MINSRDINDLHPLVKSRCQGFIAECKRQGIEVIITSTYRDNAYQATLYAQGRTAPGKVVTNARPGQSFHNYRLAFDFVPIVKGKADYNNLKTFERCGAIAEQCGLEWAGRWVKFKELVHCQFTDGLTITDLQDGKKLA